MAFADRNYHDRMPVIVAPPDFATWLDAARPPAEVERPFAPAPDASLTATPVCGWVNDARHEGLRCLEGPDEFCRGWAGAVPALHLMDPFKGK